MIDDGRQDNAILTTFLLGVFLILFVLCSLLIGGCTRRVYTPVVETHYQRDTVREVRTQYRVDTLKETHTLREIIKDSVAPRFDEGGALTGFDYFHYREKESASDRLQKELYGRVDSLLRAHEREDSVPKIVEREVVKEVNVLRWWQQWLMWIGGIALAGIAGLIGWKIYKVRKII